MIRWGAFEVEAPEVEARARELIERSRYLLAGTIRRDGTPRISPVEAHLVRGHLVLALEAGTHKVADVRRDPRIVLDAPIADPHDPGAELKIRGRAVPVDDDQLWEAVAETIDQASGWRPPADWHVVTIDLDDVAHIAWNEGPMARDRWRPGRGVEQAERQIALDTGGP